MKVEITPTVTSGFVVRGDGTFVVAGLTWDEMLGHVALLTMPPDRWQRDVGSTG